MATNLSTAKSLKNFFDKLGRPRKGEDHRNTSKAIAEAFALSENSSDYHFLLFIEVENFERLLAQIELSSIESDAKETYKKQVRELSKLLKYPMLHHRFDGAYKEVIERNYDCLTYLNDVLKLVVCFDDEAIAAVENIANHLEKALSEALKCDLPLDIKSVLDFQISRLIFLLKNYQVAGFDKVWEAASATYFTMQVSAIAIKDKDVGGIFRELAIRVAAIVGVLAALHAGIKEIAGIGSYLKSGYDLIDQWKRDRTLKIEHLPKGEGSESSKE